MDNKKDKSFFVNYKTYKTKKGDTFKVGKVGSIKLLALIEFLTKIQDAGNAVDITFGKGDFGAYLKFRENTFRASAASESRKNEKKKEIDGEEF